jgi:hypothetical protein
LKRISLLELIVFMGNITLRVGISYYYMLQGRLIIQSNMKIGKVLGKFNLLQRLSIYFGGFVEDVYCKII